MSQLKDLLEKLIRREDLAFDEAAFLMDEIMGGRLGPSQMGAFLVALRMKGETVDELAACASVMRRHVQPIQTRHKNVVDTCGTGGDRAGTFNISTLAALVTAGAGVPVAKHGNVAVSSRCGSADLLKALGVKVDASPQAMERALDDAGICFLFAPAYHPAMKHAGPTRRELGVRTLFNIVGPLTNPASAHSQIMGVFREDLTEPVARVLSRLGATRAFVVHGSDGLDEVTTTGPTRVSELNCGEVQTYDFDPDEACIARAKAVDLGGGDPARNAAIALAVLDGEPGPRRDIVVLNAAFAILASGIVSNMTGALSAAQHSIDSGAARGKLSLLVEYSNS